MVAHGHEEATIARLSGRPQTQSSAGATVTDGCATWHTLGQPALAVRASNPSAIPPMLVTHFALPLTITPSVLSYSRLDVATMHFVRRRGEGELQSRS